MKIRFQADADLNQRIVSGALRREPEIDFRTATSAGIRGLHDSDVLEMSARENRVLRARDAANFESWANYRVPGQAVVTHGLLCQLPSR